LFNAEEIVVVNAFYRLSISSVILKIFALPTQSPCMHGRTDEHSENIMPLATLCWRKQKNSHYICTRVVQ